MPCCWLRPFPSPLDCLCPPPPSPPPRSPPPPHPHTRAQVLVFVACWREPTRWRPRCSCAPRLARARPRWGAHGADSARACDTAAQRCQRARPLLLFQAAWAPKAAGRLLLEGQRHEEAISSFQAALRVDVHDAGACSRMHASWGGLQQEAAQRAPLHAASPPRRTTFSHSPPPPLCAVAPMPQRHGRLSGRRTTRSTASPLRSSRTLVRWSWSLPASMPNSRCVHGCDVEVVAAGDGARGGPDVCCCGCCRCPCHPTVWRHPPGARRAR